MKPEIMLSSGQVLDLFDPEPELMDIHVIARALSRLCRYTGHSKKFYSVAEHSLLVSSVLPEDLQLWGLLHDAAEAFIGDMTSPLKQTPLMHGFRTVEAVIEREIFKKFGVAWSGKGWSGVDATIVKHADMIALATEIQYVAPGFPEAWYWKKQNDPLPDPVVPSWTLGMTFGEAEDAFLRRFEEVS